MIGFDGLIINMLYWLGAVNIDIFRVKALGIIFILYALDRFHYHLQSCKRMPRFAMRLCKYPSCHGVQIDAGLPVDGSDETA